MTIRPNAHHALLTTRALACCLSLLGVTLLAACGEKPAAPARGPVEVTVITVTPRDTPVSSDFVAQTQSSREVEIRARVEGFLDKRLYREGELVQAGQPMFQMDRKPFEAALQSAKGQLAQQQAKLEVAKANLARVRPLAAENALSQKDLDDAIGNEQSAQAAVIAAQGQLQAAELNLSYTTITSPLTGLSSFSKKAEGSYLTPGEAGLLTYVAQLDPMYVNFSLSENEVLRHREEVAAGILRFPPNNNFEIEVVLSDGSVLPNRGRINFADPSFSKETGTFMVRAEIPNTKGLLRPGQFVKARVLGAVRPNAILVPQRAVLQGAKGHYVWLVDKEGKAEQRAVGVGDWNGDNWFINKGLMPGERVVVDGAVRVSPGAALKIAEAPAGSKEDAAAASKRPAPDAGPTEKERLSRKSGKSDGKAAQ